MNYPIEEISDLSILELLGLGRYENIDDLPPTLAIVYPKKENPTDFEITEVDTRQLFPSYKSKDI